MRDGEPGDVRTIDVRALAALGHADRVRLVDALAVHGPSTTGALSAELGLATGSVSHHLAVLRDVGLVEPAEQGADRRRSHWRLVSRGLRWAPRDLRAQPAAQAAGEAAEAVYLERQFGLAREFLHDARPPWDEAAYAGHFWLRLTPAELTEFGDELNELLLRWRRRELPDDGAADRATVLAFARAFPAHP